MKLAFTEAATGDLVVMCSTCGGECCGQCDGYTEPPYDYCPTCAMERQASESEQKREAARDERVMRRVK